MSGTFESRFCYSDEEDGVVLVGFADSQFDTKQYLLLQRSLAPDDQDSEMGMDEVHITFCDQARSTYGGVVKLLLTDEAATLALTAEAADSLGTPQRLQVRFVDCVPGEDLRQHLLLLFKEQPERLVIGCSGPGRTGAPE